MLRYCMDTDHDCHYYVIPVDKWQEWCAWLDIDTDDERAWTPPTWAHPVGGSPTTVTFTDWRIE